jgi:hypothetical protein
MKRLIPGAILFALLCPRLHAALPLSWQASNPPPTNSQLNAVAFGNGLFAAAGQQAIITSPNGMDWVLRYGAVNFEFEVYTIAYANGIFVAGGEGAALVGSSDDGIYWRITGGTITDERINGLTFGNGVFLGVGHSPSLGTAFMLVSRNGNDWVGESPPTTNELRAVAYGNNLFVAVGAMGTIITSPDATNWTTRGSGTAVTLNAITFTGSRFIVGGNTGTVLSSVDGISWTPAAPTSFDIKALASGGGAVVAVGNYAEVGKIQASADGLSWPGNAVEFSSRLYGVTYRPDYFVAVGENGLIVRSSGVVSGETNFWTKPTSGTWEEPYWSLGELPSLSNSAVVFANSGNKTLEINHDTTVSSPTSLQIRNLTVDAPLNSSNLLLLDYAGLTTPLQVAEDFTIGGRGALLDYGSAVRAQNLYVHGSATFAGWADAQLNYAYLGTSSQCGQLTISNAIVGIGRLEVFTNSCGTVLQSGGTNRIGTIWFRGNGSYNLSGGMVTVSNGLNVASSGGLTDLAISGGVMKIIFSPLRLGLSGGMSGGGRIFLEGTGTLDAAGANISVANGTFAQSGGTATVSQFDIDANINGAASAALSGGTLTSSMVFVGYTASGGFLQTGGLHANSGFIGIYGHARLGGVSQQGVYTLAGGRLDAAQEFLYLGRFNQSGGTNFANTIWVNDSGRYVLDGGRVEVNSVFVRSPLLPGEASTFLQNGGSAEIDQLLMSDGGTYQFHGGSLSIRVVTLCCGSRFRRGDVSFVNPFGVLLTGGTFFAGGGSNQLGVLNVSEALGTIDLETGGASALSFQDSRSIAWDGQLVITNWAGSLFGGGADRIYFGSDSNALSSAQLGRITFANPAGLPACNYPARMLATGEIVPVSNRPVLAYSQVAGGFQLHWESGNCQLLSSTNVAGPYQPITPQPTNPYNVTFTEPQRFFILQCQRRP